MVRRGENEAESEVAAFRPRSVPWMRALALNIVLLGTLVGIPYARGLVRAEESVGAYPAFAACFFGGTAIPGGGLSIPVGDREAYATRVLSAPPGWPLDCAPALEAIALPEAMFLLPGVKQGEVEVRAGVETMREELASLAARREADDVVPERPLLAHQRLQAALSTLLLAIGETHRGAREGVTLEAERLAAPSRIPLRVADGGTLLARGSGPSLRLVTTDASRASMVSVELERGRVLEALVRRPRAARSTGADAEHGYLYFVTSQTTCAQDAAGCAHRLMGLSRIDASVERPQAELWLRAHPRGRADRVVRVDGDAAWVVARTLGGGAELRGFRLEWPGRESADAAVTSAPGGTADDDGDDARDEEAEAGGASERALRASFAVDLGEADVLLGAGAARWLRGRELRELALETTSRAGDREAPTDAAATLPVDAPGTLVATLTIAATRLWACGGWTVAAGASGLEIVAPGGVGQWTWSAAPRPPLEGPSPEEEPVALACDETGLGVALVDEHRALALALCTADGCALGAPDAGVIDGAAIALDGSVARVATWRDEGAIFVHAIARAGAVEPAAPLPDAGIVAACWERGRGFCGPARFVSGADRVLLLARDGTDALVLTHDSGWRPLPGLGAELPSAP